MLGRLQALRERLVIDLLRITPKGALSHLIGWGARRHVPRALRSPLYRAFARQVGADLSEISQPLVEYARFNDFFIRRLLPGARTIAADERVVASPCDGVVAELGTAHEGRMIQAKGRDYSLEGLLGDADAARAFAGGCYVTIYLSPRDYHRVHSPLAGHITGYQHLPGAFFPVNPPSVRHVQGLFARNERIVTYLDSALGACALVMVAATGVGHMTMAYDAVETHRQGLRGGRPARVHYASPRAIGKGDELGAFNLGSTVVLVFAPGKVELTGLERGHKIRLGDPLARRAGKASLVSERRA